jgi:DNA-binding response OmpR family regulator
MSTHEKALILIVEDDQAMGRLLKEFLRDFGYEVEVANDAQAAYILAVELLPQLMLIDLMLPKENGDTLVMRLRQNPATNAIPVALMSCTRPELTHMGGVPFLPKPFDTEELLALINRNLHRDPASAT